MFYVFPNLNKFNEVKEKIVSFVYYRFYDKFYQKYIFIFNKINVVLISY